MSIHPREQSDIEKAFEDFKQTRFYFWLDAIIGGRFRSLVLPIVGIIDAFLVVIPTELVVVMYMARNRTAVWWHQTTIVTFFAALGYGLLALIVASFGIDAISWLTPLLGDDIVHHVTNTMGEYVLLFAFAAGATSFFPMPATAFAVTSGLFAFAVLPMMVGVFLGKGIRFGIFAYGTQRWGSHIAQYYFRHANAISLVLIVLIVLYLVIQ